MTPPVILASASVARRRLLERAGVAHDIIPSHIDERPIKDACRQNAETVEIAVRRLAEAKAVTVSQQHPERLVIGADQMLECDGRWFDKPADRDGVRRHLTQLSGRSHVLVNATVVMAAGDVVWQHGDTITMTMRRLSEAFIESYIEQAGAAACNAVGAYQLEGAGGQLFEKTEGDFFSILGLPLLPLMDFLRQRGVLPS